jgi:DNA polymerase-3 subunit gamma/tau
VTVRRLWPEVLTVVARLKRLTWTLISQNAQVQGVSDGRLTLGFSTPGLRDTFLGRSDHQDYVREALIEVLGVDWKVDAIVDPSTAPTEAAAAAPPVPSRPAAAPSGRAAAEAAVAAEAAPTGVPDAEATPSADDEDADDDALTHHDLLARELGAKVIGEYDAS